MGDVRCGTMVRCRMCRNELLYRLKSVGGECKIDDHDRVLASGDGVGRDARDAGILVYWQWSFMRHWLRGIKGSMYLLGSWRCDHELDIIPSLCEGVLVNQGIEDTPRACMRLVGSGERSGACWTGRYRRWCENSLKLVTVFTHAWGP